LGIRQQISIETELQDSSASGLSGEFRIENLVGPIPECARRRAAPEDVGATDPASTRQRSLHDDLSSSFYRGQRLFHGLLSYADALNADDLAAFLDHMLNELALMSRTALP
jgi:hypothetical protein